MRKSEIDILFEEAKEEEKYFQNYLEYVRKIKTEAKKILGEIKVFVFGSILKKDELPMDIDVLVISPKLKTTKEKSKVRARLLEKIGFSGPFEIHLINPQEYKDWYSHFIDKKIKI